VISKRVIVWIGFVYGSVGNSSSGTLNFWAY